MAFLGTRPPGLIFERNKSPSPSHASCPHFSCIRSKPIFQGNSRSNLQYCRNRSPVCRRFIDCLKITFNFPEISSDVTSNLDMASSFRCKDYVLEWTLLGFLGRVKYLISWTLPLQNQGHSYLPHLHTNTLPLPLPCVRLPRVASDSVHGMGLTLIWCNFRTT